MKYEIKSAMIGYGLVTVLLVAALVAVLVITYGAPASAADIPEAQVTFAAFAQRGDDLLLTATNGGVYKITGVDDGIDPSAFSRICNGETEVTVHAKPINPRGETAYFSVKAIYRDGEAMLDFSDSARLERGENLPTVLLLAGMTLIWCAVLTLAVIVGRDPSRFSPRVVRLFFREAEGEPEVETE